MRLGMVDPFPNVQLAGTKVFCHGNLMEPCAEILNPLLQLVASVTECLAYRELERNKKTKMNTCSLVALSIIFTQRCLLPFGENSVGVSEGGHCQIECVTV